MVAHEKDEARKAAQRARDNWISERMQSNTAFRNWLNKTKPENAIQSYRSERDAWTFRELAKLNPAPKSDANDLCMNFVGRAPYFRIHDKRIKTEQKYSPPQIALEFVEVLEESLRELKTHKSYAKKNFFDESTPEVEIHYIKNGDFQELFEFDEKIFRMRFSPHCVPDPQLNEECWEAKIVLRIDNIYPYGGDVYLFVPKKNSGIGNPSN